MVMKIRISDPKGVLFQFEGSQMEFERFMERFDVIEAYMDKRRRELEEEEQPRASDSTRGESIDPARERELERIGKAVEGVIKVA